MRFLMLGLFAASISCSKVDTYIVRPGEHLDNPRQVATSLFETVEEALSDAWPEVHDNMRSAYGEPLSEERIRQVEEELGLVFPQSYVDLMTAQNGGYLRIRWKGMDDERYTDFDRLNPLDKRTYGDHASAYMINEWEYPSPSYWLGGDGHTAILLDYRNLVRGEEPPVLYVDLEANPPKEEIIFPTFKAFVDYLLEQKDLE